MDLNTPTLSAVPDAAPTTELVLDEATNTFVSKPIAPQAPEGENADGDEATATAPAQRPRRSWSRSKEDPSKFDGTFEYDGATIYIKSLTKAQRVILKVKQEENSKQTTEIQAQLKAAETEQKENQKQLERIQIVLKAADNEEDKKALENQISEVQLKIAAIEEDQEALGDLMSEVQTGYMQTVLNLTIRYWENGDVPFSHEALRDLPFEIMFAWVQAVIQKSMVGLTEADFLKNN